MRRLLLILACITSLSASADAQNSDIEATIGAQMEAFKADDFATAFTYASPSIQGIFQSPEVFGGMVRNGYPMVWRPADVRFLELREIGGALWQKVQVTDSGGKTHILDYQMIQLDSGWKINGVQLLESSAVAA